MPYFKINHEHELDWIVDDDLLTFIVVAVERQTKFRFSTYVYTNRKQQSAISSKYTVIGHHTLKPISQFDMKIETNITCLDATMKILGIDALRAFLNANSHQPLAYSNLAEILSSAGTNESSSPLDYEF